MKRMLLVFLMAAMVLGFAGTAWAETFQGFVIESEGAFALDEIGGGVFLLEGAGLEQFLEKEVIIEGELLEGQDGSLIIDVYQIREIEGGSAPGGETVSLVLTH